MSRAFVKEPDGDQAEDDLPDIPQSDEPNYITPSGFKQLQSKYQKRLSEKKTLSKGNQKLSTKIEIKEVERDLRFLKQRLERAIVVNSPEQSSDEQSSNRIRFGATVFLIDENDQKISFTLVGEDETCAPTKRIGWTSPLGKALLGQRTGDVVYWERPIGNIELEIESFSYDKFSNDQTE